MQKEAFGWTQKLGRKLKEAKWYYIEAFGSSAAIAASHRGFSKDEVVAGLLHLAKIMEENMHV